jgi:hypothetical protein
MMEEKYISCPKSWVADEKVSTKTCDYCVNPCDKYLEHLSLCGKPLPIQIRSTSLQRTTR